MRKFWNDKDRQALFVISLEVLHMQLIERNVFLLFMWVKGQQLIFLHEIKEYCVRLSDCLYGSKSHFSSDMSSFCPSVRYKVL